MSVNTFPVFLASGLSSSIAGFERNTLSDVKAFYTPLLFAKLCFMPAPMMHK